MDFIFTFGGFSRNQSVLNLPHTYTTWGVIFVVLSILFWKEAGRQIERNLLIVCRNWVRRYVTIYLEHIYTYIVHLDALEFLVSVLSCRLATYRAITYLACLLCNSNHLGLHLTSGNMLVPLPC